MDSEVTRASPTDRFGLGVVNVALGIGTFTWVSEFIGAFVIKIGFLMVLSGIYSGIKTML